MDNLPVEIIVIICNYLDKYKYIAAMVNWKWFNIVFDKKQIIPLSPIVQHLGLIEWALKNNCNIFDQLGNCAAICGSKNAIKWLIDKKYKLNKNIIVFAARSGNIKLIKFLVKNGYKIKEECYLNAVKYGHLATIVYFENENVYLTKQNISKIYRKAIKREHFKIIKFFYLQRIICNNSINYAIKYDKLDIFKWLTTEAFDRKSIVITLSLLKLCAKYGSVKILDHIINLITLEYKDILLLYQTALDNNRESIIDYFNNIFVINYNGEINFCNYCIEKNNLTMLKWLNSKEYIWNDNTLIEPNYNYEIIQYLKLNNCTYSDLFYFLANRKGYKDIENFISNEKITVDSDGFILLD